MRFSTRLTLILLPVSITSAYADSNFTVYGSGNFAPLSGFIQVPAGGTPGTSSIEKPTFNQLGLTQTSFYQLGFEYDNDWLGFYGQYQHLRPAGHEYLNENITTHGIFLPKNTSVASDNKFDLYRVGINHRFFLSDKFVLAPELEITSLHFAYEFATPILHSSRAFHSMTERLGLEVEYYLSKSIYLSGNAATSIPKTSNLQVQTANADVNFKIAKNKDFETTVFTGVGYEKIHFEDKQTLPNNINLVASPMAELGIKFSF